MDELLFFLLKKGAHKNPLRMNTTEIGKELNMSQQNVSHRLLQLEREGFVKRERINGVQLTDKAEKKIRDFLQEIQKSLEKNLTIMGILVSGKQEGKKFLSMDEYKRKINNEFGFVPYAGTLNIRLDGSERKKRSRLLATEPKIIEGFEKHGKRYGDLYCYECKINGIEGAIIFPLRTRHGSEILEIISAENLRKKLKLADGKKVVVVV